MARLRRAPGEKPLWWVGSSLEDLRGFPAKVQDEIGTALSVAQFGGKHPQRSLGKARGPGLFEVVENYRTDTYRAVYTVRFERAVYVLHAFQKKSPSGIRTSKRDIASVERRLSEARSDYEARYGKA